MFKQKTIVLFLQMAIIMVITACSSQKNTAKSRWWQSFTAKYNTYYNGTLAYIDGSLEKEKGNKDNYTEIIPLYTVGNKSSQSLGSGNYDKAIEKCQKAIKLHSIGKRPEWTKNRRKTARDIEWLNRREYNPMMWKAWMLMGRSQFYKGAFDEAAATFAYMSRMYQTQPAIYGKARAWLAKCYIEQEWLYDAEDVIRNMSRDSLDWRAVKEWDYTYADYYIHAGEYEKAIPYLKKVIKHEMRRKQKAREYFLLGQLEAQLGHKDLAYKAYKKVLGQNPPYELDFNARIAMTEVMASGRTKQTISKLKRMAANDNNKDYLDQVYYAMGNVYLLDKDTLNAISAYEKGNTKGTRNGIEKGVLLLKLGDLYWGMEKFGDAQRCYGTAIGLLDKERKDYAELSRRSKILDELAPYTDAIHLQDSLLELSTMPEKERNEAIDRVIEALKKKEKEERKAQQEELAQQTMARNGGQTNRTQNRQPQMQQDTQQKGEWYFYNQLAVSQGKSTFQKLWGKRENVDNWQRINQTVVSDFNTDDLDNMTEAMRDSLAALEAAEDSLATVKDSAQNDPHKREYYLAQIPFEEEQKAECHTIISDGLFHSGIIFKDQLDNLRLSKKQFDRLTNDYPDFEKMDEVYYHLFLLYSRLNDSMTADSYIEQLKEKYPESQWTTILSDPYYAENSKFGVHLEDSLYTATYNAFKADRFQEVYTNATLSETRFPLGANRDKFIFIRGLSRLNNNDADGCLEDMNLVVKNFPSSRISEMAGMIVNGVKEGRRLHGGKFDLGDVWSRRTQVLSDSDSIAARKFIADRNKEFRFIIAYHPDSLNENQLLFELARFNFTTYIVRNFDIVIEDADGLHLMEVSGFSNFDEAHQYADEVSAHENIVKRMLKARKILISEENLPLLGRQYSYDDYEEFYIKHFAPLKVNDQDLLSEPDEIGYEREPDINLPRQDEDNQSQDDMDEGIDMDSGDDNQDVAFPDEMDISDTPDSPGNINMTDDLEIPDTPDNPNNTNNTDNPNNTGNKNNTGNTDNSDVPDIPEIPDDSDDDGFDIPTDDDGFDIPSEDDGPNIPTDDDGFDLPTPTGSGASAGTGTPVSNGFSDDIDISDDNNSGNNSTVEDEDEGFILQAPKKKDTGKLPEVKTDAANQMKGNPHPLIRQVKTSTTKESSKKTESLPEKKQPEKKQPEKKQPEKKQPEKKQPQKLTEVQLPDFEDTGIYFDEDIDDPQPVKSTGKKKKEEKQQFDLEDEYYELDGF